MAAIVIGCAAAPIRSAPPATQASDPQEAALRRWVRDLADGDPDVRDRARLELMGLERSALDRLRRVVADSSPLAPSQTAALEEIVSHLFLAAWGDVAAPEPKGFLGVRYAETAVELAPGPGVRAEGMPIGIAIRSRVPGFEGYRVLRDGDVIVRVTTEQPREFRNSEEFRRLVSDRRPGEVVTLDVLRRGHLVRVPVTLGRRPAWAEQAGPNDNPYGSPEREAAVAEYWERTFGPLVAERRS